MQVPFYRRCACPALVLQIFELVEVLGGLDSARLPLGSLPRNENFPFELYLEAFDWHCTVAIVTEELDGAEFAGVVLVFLKGHAGDGWLGREDAHESA